MSHKRHLDMSDTDTDSIDDDDEQSEHTEPDTSVMILQDNVVEAVINALHEVTNSDVRYTTRKAALTAAAEKVTANIGINIEYADISNCIAIAKSRINHYKSNQQKYLKQLALYNQKIANETSTLLAHPTRNTPTRIAAIKAKYRVPTQPADPSDLHIHRRVADAELALRARINQPKPVIAASTHPDGSNLSQTQAQSPGNDATNDTSNTDGAVVNLSAKRKLETLRGAARKLKRRQLENIQIAQQQTQDRVNKSYDMLQSIHNETVAALQTQSQSVAALTSSIRELINHIVSKKENRS